LVQVRELTKYFPSGGGLFGTPRLFLRAVENVSFDVLKGETLTLVGESGSGKTTTARLVLRLIEPTSGTVLFNGQDLFKLAEDEMRLIRPRAQIVFQDPLASLNPRKTVMKTLEQPFKVHTSFSNKEIRDGVVDLLEQVGLTPPERFLDRFPHELSGGERQRVCIARAIALKPMFVVSDEPVSALDVSIRGQILNLLKNLQEDLGITYLYITHDLSVARSISSRLAVMYLGKIVEIGDASEIFRLALHPYTQALLSAVPIPNPEVAKTKKPITLTGEPPSPINPPQGCRFHPRCSSASEKCRREEPSLIKREKRLVACHLYA